MVWWERKNCEGFVSESFVIQKPKPKPKPTNPKTPYKIHNNIQRFGEFCFILFYFTFFHLWRHIYAGLPDETIPEICLWEYPRNMLKVHWSWNCPIKLYSSLGNNKILYKTIWASVHKLSAEICLNLII